MPGISMRYIVDDVDAALEFYTKHLDFAVALHPAPTFAILTKDGFRLLVSGMTGPGGGAQGMPDGRKPEPGGWNRIQIEVADLEAEVATLRQAGARFRGEIVQGIGGKQILLEDPAGNPIELFEAPKR
ncbi:VOC family protein [Rhizobium sp. F40D2]|uniref:VOC family protein n=1 Tax=Rhizobium sp. F40D2 TaxID=3453141 RepID=UPI003F1EF419